LKTAILVGIGGFIGSLSRYGFNVLFKSFAYPASTFLVNIIGCLIIGVIAALSQKLSISNDLKFFVATGFCGGFTTFSAFALENQKLFSEGNYSLALAYIIASVIIGILMVYLGYFFGSKI
jgi:fluoride exporter